MTGGLEGPAADASALTPWPHVPAAAEACGERGAQAPAGLERAMRSLDAVRMALEAKTWIACSLARVWRC
jgi:hypothetical protein